MSGEFVSAATVAKCLGVSSRTVIRWCQAGRIPGAWQPAGYLGSWFIPLSYLEHVSEMSKARPAHEERPMVRS